MKKDSLFNRSNQLIGNRFKAALTSMVSRLGQTVRDPFDVLIRIEYEAPWMRPVGKARCN